MELAAAGARDAAPTTMTDAGYEMVVGGNADGAGGRILGHRQFARYYRQKYAAGDPRRSLAAASSVLSQCARSRSALLLPILALAKLSGHHMWDDWILCPSDQFMSQVL